MRKSRSRVLLVELVVLCFLASALGVIVHAEEEYQLRATIESHDPQPNANFGMTVGVYGDLIVISESSANVEGESTAGRTHIFDLDGNLIKTIHATPPRARDSFGNIQKIKDNIFVISERVWVDGTPLTGGSLYFFDFDGNPLFDFEPPVNKADDYYRGVEFCGDTIFVPHPGYDFEGYTDAGRIHLYDWEGNYLKAIYPPEPRSLALFGIEKDSCDDIFVVGDFHANVEGIEQAGKVYLYDSDGNLVSTLQSPDPQKYEMFGYEVGICGDRIAIFNNIEKVEGKVYLFNSDGDFLKTLSIPELVGDPGLVFKVYVRGDFILVSLHEAEVEGLEEAGIGYLFDREGNYLKTIQSPAMEQYSMWEVFTRDIITSEDCSNTQFFVISEPGADGGSVNEGRVHIFDSDGDLQQTLYSPEPMASSEFGYSVYLMDDLIVVSEYGGKKTGIVHVFQQSGIDPTPSPSPTPSPTPDPPGGIPGFPLESVVIGLTFVILLLWFRK
jgi:hypothetical protein